MLLLWHQRSWWGTDEAVYSYILRDVEDEYSDANLYITANATRWQREYDYHGWGQISLHYSLVQFISGVLSTSMCNLPQSAKGVMFLLLSLPTEDPPLKHFPGTGKNALRCLFVLSWPLKLSSPNFSPSQRSDSDDRHPATMSS